MLTTDFFQIEELLTPEQRLITQVVKEFSDIEINIFAGFCHFAKACKLKICIIYLLTALVSFTDLIIFQYQFICSVS